MGPNRSLERTSNSLARDAVWFIICIAGQAVSGRSAPKLARMNPRRIHELMRQHFPPVEHAARTWAVVQRENGANSSAIASLLVEHIGSSEVLVEVHRKLGALLPTAAAPAYIGSHIGEGEIRVTDRQFTGFVVVAVNGVATGWRNAGANPSLHLTFASRLRRLSPAGELKR